jgi:hypothetical protein
VGDALAVKSESVCGTVCQLAAAPDVRVRDDSTDRMLHVARAWGAIDVGNIHTARSIVASLETLVEAIGVGHLTGEIITHTVRSTLNRVRRAALAHIGLTVGGRAGQASATARRLGWGRTDSDDGLDCR